jgi:phage gpG-like protein
MPFRNIQNGKELSQEMSEDALQFKNLVDKRLPEKVAVTLEKVIIDSFEGEGYQDKPKSKWKKRKSKKDDEGRKILVKKGDLKRSPEVRIEGKDIIASTDIIYAQAHNEGNSRLPQRQFMPIPGEENKLLDDTVEKWLDSEMDKIFK